MTLCYVLCQGVLQLERLITHIAYEFSLIMHLFNMSLEISFLFEHCVAYLASLLLHVAVLFPHVSRQVRLAPKTLLAQPA